MALCISNELSLITYLSIVIYFFFNSKLYSLKGKTYFQKLFCFAFSYYWPLKNIHFNINIKLIDLLFQRNFNTLYHEFSKQKVIAYCHLFSKMISITFIEHWYSWGHTTIIILWKAILFQLDVFFSFLRQYIESEWIDAALLMTIQSTKDIERCNYIPKKINILKS